MELTRYADLDWVTRPSLNESDGRAAADKTRVKMLHHGVSGQPGHFEMAVTSYNVPKNVKRHRHDTDQFRFTLRGISPWAPGYETAEGNLLFIPSGTPYGPYERPVGIELLQVEFEGADGSPFVDIDHLVATKEQMAQVGTFDDDVFTWVGDDGQQHRKAEFRAVIEAATGRVQAIPHSRFTVPIEIVPDNFTWIEEAPGSFVREFIVLPERGTRMWQFALEPGAARIVGAMQKTLLFVLRGSGRVNDLALAERDSIKLDIGDEVELVGDERLEVLVLGLPHPMDGPTAVGMNATERGTG